MKTLKTCKFAVGVSFLLLFLSGPCLSKERSIDLVEEPSGRLSLTPADMAALLKHVRDSDKANKEFDEEYQKLLKKLDETRNSMRCS